jgi:hypothetical protein
MMAVNLFARSFLRALSMRRCILSDKTTFIKREVGILIEICKSSDLNFSRLASMYTSASNPVFTPSGVVISSGFSNVNPSVRITNNAIVGFVIPRIIRGLINHEVFCNWETTRAISTNPRLTACASKSAF